MDKFSLVKRCQEGDKAAFGQLYNVYSMQMMRIVCHYVMDWHAAQDILHDGFVVIISNIKQLRDASRLEYWMGAIMKNLSLQYLKEQDITQLMAANFDIPDVPGFDESITMAELEAMIQRLPKGYQKVFRLAILENKSHKEISKLLGISEGTSGSQLFHARILIRKMIIEHKMDAGLLVLALALILGILTNRTTNDISQSIITLTPEDKSGIQSSKEIPSLTFNDSNQVVENLQKLQSHSKTLLSRPLNMNSTETSEDYVAENPNYDSSAIAADLSTSTVVIDSICIIEYDDMSLTIDQLNDTTSVQSAPLTTLTDNIDSERGDYSHDNIFHRADRNYISVSGNMSNIYGRSIVNRYPDLMFSDPDDLHHHSMPITFSLNISKSITERVAVETGVQYSILNTETRYEKVNVNYIGVPLRIRYEILPLNHFSLYSTVGSMIEFPVKGVVDYSKGQSENFNPPVQWSASVGVGVQYDCTNHIGIFVEACAVYYLKTSTNHPMIRTDYPLDFNIPIGVRLRW